MPTAWAATLTLQASIASRAILNPLPSSPIILATGILQLSKISSVVEAGCSPIFLSILPTEKPGASLSMTKALMPRYPSDLSLVAKVVIKSASAPLVLKVLLPLRM